jgi:hypothetical protein
MGMPEVYLDPPGPKQYRGKLFDRSSNPYAGDDILAPFVELQGRLEAAGYRVHTADALPSRPGSTQRILVSFGVPDRMPVLSLRRYRALAGRSDVTLSAFVALESPIVEPRMYEALPALSRLFHRVLSWSDTESLLPFTGVPVKVERFWWPQSIDAVYEDLWSKLDRKFLVLMNANKLPRLYHDELYTARLRAVQYFHAFGEIDLYGRNWDRAPVRVGKTYTPAVLRRLEARFWSWRQRRFPDPVYVAAAAASLGPVLSKSATLAKYRFALCFENSILRGWMTEKLFDCFAAGTVPVYWGAPDILEWVPAECFIDMRQFRDFADLRGFLKALPAAAEARYREAGRAYLASSQFDRFRRRTFAAQLHRIIDADARPAGG